MAEHSHQWVQTLWKLHSHGSDEHSAGRVYWWENRQCEPAGAVVVQATLAGQIVLRRGGDPATDCMVGPGQVLTFRYGDDTAYGWPEPLPQRYACQWVVMTGAGLVEHFEALQQTGGEVTGPDGSIVDAITALRHRLAQHAGLTEASEIAQQCYALITRMISASADAGLADCSPVQRAIELILRDPFKDWSIMRLAQQHGVSREHLCRVFAQRMGQPPHAWLTTRRLDKAVLLLRQTSLPLEQVAQQAGFATTHTLSRQVRIATGMTPPALRAQGNSTRRPGEVNTSSAET